MHLATRLDRYADAVLLAQLRAYLTDNQPNAGGRRRAPYKRYIAPVCQLQQNVAQGVVRNLDAVSFQTLVNRGALQFVIRVLRPLLANDANDFLV